MNCISKALRPSASPGTVISALRLLFALLLPLQSQPPSRAAGSDQQKTSNPIIVASCFPAYCFAYGVASGQASISLLSSTGEGPHNHQLSPAELRRLQTADVVVINGLGLEPWSARLKDIAAKSGRPRIVECAAGLGSELIREEEDSHEHHDGHHHGDSGANPHIWLDPLLAGHAATNIAKALIEVAPNRRESFEQGLKEYSGKLQQLHIELQTATKAFSKRQIVTYHDAFPYFLRRYDLKLAGVIQAQPEGSALPKSLSSLSRKIRAEGIGVIFAEPQFSPRLAQRLSQDLRVVVDTLDTLETGPLKPGAYEEAMRANLKTLERHLR